RGARRLVDAGESRGLLTLDAVERVADQTDAGAGGKAGIDRGGGQLIGEGAGGGFGAADGIEAAVERAGLRPRRAAGRDGGIGARRPEIAGVAVGGLADELAAADRL